MKKKKKIFFIVLALVIAAGVTGFFLLKNGKAEKKKTYENGSVEAESEIVINKWLKAISEENTDAFIQCCYTDSLLNLHAELTGLDMESFKQYIKYVYVVGGFEFRNVEIQKKSRLDEDAYYKINSMLGEKDRIEGMYSITFTYDIRYDDEWTTVEETCGVFMIKGQCYIDNLSDSTIYDK